MHACFRCGTKNKLIMSSPTPKLHTHSHYYCKCHPLKSTQKPLKTVLKNNMTAIIIEPNSWNVECITACLYGLMLSTDIVFLIMICYCLELLSTPVNHDSSSFHGKVTS